MGPLRNVAVPLSPGLNVLYGLNGAGKSTVLEALQMALTGSQETTTGLWYGWSNSCLFLRLQPSTQAEEDPWGDLLNDYLPEFDSDDEDFTGDPQEMVQRQLNLALNNRIFNTEEISPYYDDIIEQALQQRLFAVIPKGRGERRWDVYIAVEPDEEGPLRHLFDSESRYRDAWIRRNWDLLDVPADHPIRHDHEEELADEAAWQYYHSFFVSQARASLGLDENADFPYAEAPRDDGVPWTVAPYKAWNKPPPGFPRLLAEDPSGEALDTETRQALASAYQHADSQTGAEAGIPHEFVSALESEANRLLSHFLLDAPSVTLNPRTPPEWLGGSGPVWETEDGHDMNNVSKAEKRWISLAIRLAIIDATSGSERPLVVIIDEPEAALHRTAEEHMANGLAELGRRPGTTIVAATHSPHLLDQSDASVNEVHRRRDKVVGRFGRVTSHKATVRPLPAPQVEQLERLGLRTSDLLRRWQVVLLVEGHHEEIIFNAAIGPALRRARTHVLPFGGVGQLHAVVDSRLLWDFTDAQFIPVVDNEKAGRLDEVWERAMWLDAAEGIEAAVDHIENNLKKRDGFETQAMQEFLKLAIAKGRPTYSRIRPFAFSKPDITDYLPLDVLLPEKPNKTWAKLRKEHVSQSGQQPTAFKSWVEKAYGKQLGRTIFTDEAIREAARAMEVPEEFEMLVRRCENAGPPDR